jgi:transposase
MLAELLLPDDQELSLESCYLTDDVVNVEMTARQPFANCCQCGTTSARIHSRYQRTLADLPCTAFSLKLFWTVRRFFCDNPDCERVTFVEQVASVAARYARKTKRMRNYQVRLAYALGGRPGARLAQDQGITVSPDTMIRLIRDTPEPEETKSRVVGVDDWAFRKGYNYGTLLVDLEKRCPIDLLSERSAEALTNWLKEHPEVEIISRDRSNEYRKGAKTGAPQAVQVADRWHLLKNLREAIERHLEQHQASLAAAGQTQEPCSKTSQVTEPKDRSKKMTKHEQKRQITRMKRFQRYETVKQLHKLGFSQRAIARRMSIGTETVRKYLKSDKFPEYAKRKKKESILDPYKDYLEKRWQEGLRNASELWRELQKEKGYTGARGMVGLWAAAKRKAERDNPKIQTTDSTLASPWSAKRASWLIFGEESDLSDADWQALQRMLRVRPELFLVQELTRDFLKMVRQRQPEKLTGWLEQVKEAKVASLESFGRGIQQDISAVKAALMYEWSNGQTEGQVNRLKMIKRQMYGRANFDLLRKRVLGLSRPP